MAGERQALIHYQRMPRSDACLLSKIVFDRKPEDRYRYRRRPRLPLQCIAIRESFLT